MELDTMAAPCGNWYAYVNLGFLCENGTGGYVLQTAAHLNVFETFSS
jgi:hypothetical protein